MRKTIDATDLKKITIIDNDNLTNLVRSLDELIITINLNPHVIDENFTDLDRRVTRLEQLIQEQNEPR